MRQVFITKHGGPEVLQVREMPDPQPRPGEVRIRVRAAGVNFADVLARVGLYPDSPKLPCVVGYEVAGVTDTGERVVAMTRFGGYSEIVCVPRALVFPLPERLSFSKGAAIPVVYLTAWHMLVELAHARRGHTALIHAAAGGVGTAALQICKHLGVRTIGTASASKHARLRELGLDHAIDYRTQDFEKEVLRITEGRGVDVALDAVGGTSFRKSYRCLAPVGRLCMFGASATSAGETRNPLRAAATVARMPFFHPLEMLNANKGVFGVNMGRLWKETELLAGELREIFRLVDQGVLDPIVDAEVPLAEAGKAHHRLQSRQNFGKVVLVS